MDDLISAETVARIRQSFLLGLARQPLAVPPSLKPLIDLLGPEREPALALLALVGQRQRFVGPAVPPADPPSDIARQMHADPRPILPDAARRALQHLGGSVDKSDASFVLAAALRRVAEAGFRPHPFDLPDLARHLKDDPGAMGVAERAYLALVTRDGEDDGDRTRFYHRITLENWTTFPKAHRRQFVATLRKGDQAAGRALVEGVWKTEPAPVRHALLQAMETGLSADDRPFLDALARDRAETVKQLAARMITCIPGSVDEAERIDAAAKCFAPAPRSVAGKLLAAFGGAGSRSPSVMFQMPPHPDGLTTSGSEQAARLHRLFAGLSLPALAERVGVSPEAILDAIPFGQHELVWFMIDSALAAGDATMAGRIVSHRLLAAETLPHFLVVALVTRARVTLDPGDAGAFLASPVWAHTVTALRDETRNPSMPPGGGLMVHVATLVPHPAIPAFLASIADLPLAATRAARDFADLVLALGAAAPSSRS